MSEKIPNQEVIEDEEVEGNPVSLKQLSDRFKNKKDGGGVTWKGL